MVSTNFYFNGESNETYGVYLVRQSNIIDEIFTPEQEIKEEHPTSAKVPTFYGTRYLPYEFLLTFSTLTNDLTATKLKSISNWLFKDEYKAFYSEDNDDKIFYIIAKKIDLSKTITKEGFFTITFKSLYPYALTAEATPTYSLSDETLVINNTSNAYTYYRPEIEFVVGAGTSTVSFVNTSDSNRTTTFTNLTLGETIYVDNERKRIISDTQTYPYNNFNKVWLRLIQGNNSISVTGTITLTLRQRFPMFT